MKILIACEESQIVTKEFRKLGHEAYSCDIQECSGGHPEWHIKDNVLKVINDNWDMMVAHPPCTYLSYAGIAHWNKPGRLEKRLNALEFFAKLWLAPINKICIENPKGCASPTIAKYTQEIQPYYFGDNDLKTTWLWLKNLSPLIHFKKDDLFNKGTHVKPKVYAIDNTKRKKKRYFADGYTRNQKMRSKTFPGIAKAMAQRWGDSK
jgi:hypothetical protein